MPIILDQLGAPMPGSNVGCLGGPVHGMNGMYADQRSYDQALSLANLRSALAVQQAEIEDLQRVKREMREQIGMEREMCVRNLMLSHPLSFCCAEIRCLRNVAL